MHRREVLVGAAAAALIPLGSSAVAASLAVSSALSPLAEAAREAYIYTLPLIESAAARAAVVTGQKQAPGTLFRLRQPTTPATQRVTTPNNDTLNARGWFDLAAGPVRLTLPATGDRYVSVAMMDMYSNNFAVLGSRTTGPDGGTFTIVGPGLAAPSEAIRSPTRWMWVLIRLLTTGGADLGPARAMQDAFTVEAPAFSGSLATYSRRDASWSNYFLSAAKLLAENPPPATDRAILRRIAQLGLAEFTATRFSPAQAADIAAGVAEAKRQLLTGAEQGPVVAGWAYPRSTLGNFAQDYAYRAQTALNGFAALPVDEAIYLFAAGPRGDMRLDSSQRWRLRLAGDRLPPVDAFWSLTMYRATTDGQFFLFDNPINRYSIGDRTPGLLRTTDGSLQLLLQRDAPASGANNWLPTPLDGPFGVVFRCYRPRPALRDGEYRLPPLEHIV